MADKQNSQKVPTMCRNNCNFYGNPLYGDYCSKCFNELKEANQPASATATASPAIQTQAPAITLPSSAEPSAAAAISCAAGAAGIAQEPSAVSASPAASMAAAAAGMEPCVLPPAVCEKPSNSLPTSSMQSPLTQIASAATGASTPTKRVFNKKSRCAECKIRVPLAKQAINQCRCSYFFCDKHRYPEQHECEFDFMTRDRLDLARNNPKLNSRPKGGLSFTRID